MDESAPLSARLLLKKNLGLESRGSAEIHAAATERTAINSPVKRVSKGLQARNEIYVKCRRMNSIAGIEGWMAGYGFRRADKHYHRGHRVTQMA